MFRVSAGFKAQYQELTLIIASDFDEWRIFVQSPSVVIQGGRQFSEVKAKDCAKTIADSYIRDQQHLEPRLGSEVEWAPMEAGTLLNWRP